MSTQNAVREMEHIAGVAPRYVAEFVCLDQDCPVSCPVEDNAGSCPAYPRWLWFNGSQVEMCGLLSCPEMARLCLGQDQSMDLTGFDATSLFEDQTMPSEADNTRPFVAHESTVKQVILDVLALEHRPLAARIFALASFGRDMDTVFGAESFQEQDMALAVEALSSGRYFQVWEETGGENADSAAVAMAVVQLFFDRLVRDAADADLQNTVKDALAVYAADEGTAEMLHQGAEGIRLDCAVLAAAWKQRMERLPSELFQQVESMLTRVLQNRVLSCPYVLSSSLSGYVQDLGVISAALRFLLLSHPDVDQVCRAENETDRSRAGERFGRTGAESVSRVFRAMDKSPQVMAELDAALQKEGLTGRGLSHMLAGM